MIAMLVTAFVTFILAFLIVPIILWIARMFGLYAIVNEGTATFMCCSAKSRRC